jgi:hypothetical protein
MGNMASVYIVVVDLIGVRHGHRRYPCIHWRLGYEHFPDTIYPAGFVRALYTNPQGPHQLISSSQPLSILLFIRDFLTLCTERIFTRLSAQAVLSFRLDATLKLD